MNAPWESARPRSAERLQICLEVILVDGSVLQGSEFPPTLLFLLKQLLNGVFNLVQPRKELLRKDAEAIPTTSFIFWRCERTYSPVRPSKLDGWAQLFLGD